MALILHLITPFLLAFGFFCSAHYNATGTSDIRVIDYDEFTRRFQDDTASLIRDGVIKVYRTGSRLHFFLARLFYALTIIAYLANTILLTFKIF